MKIDKEQKITEIQNKYKTFCDRGLLSENESRLMISLWESRRYTPAAVLPTNGGDYFDLYTITEQDGTVIGTYAAIIAGRNAGKHETIVYKAGYTKRDVNRLYKEYRV